MIPRLLEAVGAVTTVGDPVFFLYMVYLHVSTMIITANKMTNVDEFIHGCTAVVAKRESGVTYVKAGRGGIVEKLVVIIS